MRAADLFGPGVSYVEAPAVLTDGDLFPEEAAFIEGAVASRRAEFGTARACARSALASLGVKAGALLPREGRGPIWPAGTVGSITHTHGHCAVVVGRSPPLRAIGLDVEVLRPLDPGVLALVLTANERAWLEAQPPDLYADRAVTFFCAKEAFYKCQHTLTETFLDFQDVEVLLQPDRMTFEARVLKAPWPSETARLQGRVAYEAGRVACGVELRG